MSFICGSALYKLMSSEIGERKFRTDDLGAHGGTQEQFWGHIEMI
ncbi:hypothetical protein CIRG_03781 [Coccidioides immitis RMSCC 2394]|uniref:Uncharacterized protein n=1 Tax=Coccidioides immitis RMSCC 2394 TaxID=404692 RepID=A0A0J6Y8Q7_COCIT|nr:hypothetical protein CIRG_03781 [Coccidioides immitis RMSCC 2394]